MPYVRRSTKRPTRKPARKPTRKAPARHTRKVRQSPKQNGAIMGGTAPSVQRGYLPFGRQYFAKLPYVENFAISASGTTQLSATQYTYVSNSVYDPRYETGGHQPLQYDYLAAVYERVWVHGAKVTLTFSNPTHDGMWVGYRCRAATNSVATSGQNLEYVQEMRDSIIKPCNNTGSQTKTFTFYVPNYRLFGITKTQYTNLEYSHVINAAPTAFGVIEPFAIHTVVGETGVIRCNIKITYFCQFTNPITAPQS